MVLFTGYSLEIFKSKCNPGAHGVHCYAHLNNDISEVLPYLNSRLGGGGYIENPPSLTLKNYGKLITLYGQKIAVNALKDREEANKIIGWLQREINDTWRNRLEIKPSTATVLQPVLFEVFKLLPKTNCKECNEQTCLVFASRVIEGVKDQNDCPPIAPANKVKLLDYLSQFSKNI